jgi:hypothetical protein
MNSTKLTLALLATVCGFSLLTAQAAQAETPDGQDKMKVTLSTSYNYSTGDYGQANDTKITYVPVTAKAKYDDWTAKLTVPYLKIEGPGVVVGGDGGDPLGAAGAVGTESGLGDIIASLAYKYKLNTQGTAADFTGKIKFPTADDKKNLGTGNTDYTLQLGLTQPIGDAFITGSVGRKFNGTSARFQLDDVWKYSAGGGYKFTPEVTAGAMYDFRQGATATSKNFSQATAFITYDLSDSWATQVYGATGFTDAAPNSAYGIQLSYKFGATDTVD